MISVWGIEHGEAISKFVGAGGVARAAGEGGSKFIKGAKAGLGGFAAPAGAAGATGAKAGQGAAKFLLHPIRNSALTAGGATVGVGGTAALKNNQNKDPNS